MKPAPISPGEAERLWRLRQLGILDTAAEHLLDTFTIVASRETGMPIALISLVDADRQWFKSAVGLPQGAQTPRSYSFCGHAIAHEGIFEVEDATRDPDFADNPLVTGAPHVVHYAGMPLAMPDGERVGTLCLIDHKPGRLTADQRRLLVDLAGGVVNAILMRENLLDLRRGERLSHLEAAVELAPVAMISLNADGEVCYANSRWHTLLNLPTAYSAMGWNWLQAVHPDERDALCAAWEEAIAQRRRLATDFRTRNDRLMRLMLEPADTTVSVAGFVATMADITERLTLLRAQSAQTQLLTAILQSMPTGVMVYDEQQRHHMSNAQARRLSGLPDHLLEANATFEQLSTYLALAGELGPGDPQELVRQRMAVMGLPSSRGQVCVSRTRPDGTAFDVRGVTLDNGWKVHVYTDTTEEQQRRDELARQTERLALALKASRLGMWEYEPLIDRLYLSESWGEPFGYPVGEQVVCIAQMTEMVPSESVAAFLGATQDLVKGRLAVMDLEHQMLDAQGQMVWVNTRAEVTERDAQGTATRIVGTTQNITVRKLAQLALEEAKQEAERSSAAKARFVATMSHEIRTPINGVIGLAQMLRDCGLPAQEASYVRMINSCADTLLALVNDVLDFSKIEAGQMELQAVQTDLHALACEIGDVFEARARAKGLAFQVRVLPTVPRLVMVDAHRLRQILLNLLGNALKFTAAGSFSLVVDAFGAPARLQLAVMDTGAGIAPEAIGRLFQHYSQADVSVARNFQGTGLGLAICKELAQLMGGDITVTSTPAEGSTFMVDIPLEAVQNEATASPPAPVAQPDHAAACARVLLVEDNAINQLVARTLLTRMGYRHIVVAGDGHEALAACAAQAFDVVLMDCQMPGMDGLEATRQLRAQGLCMPIIALTAHAIEDERQKCLASGMDDFLSKPISLAQLQAVMVRHQGLVASVGQGASA